MIATKVFIIKVKVTVAKQRKQFSSFLWSIDTKLGVCVYLCQEAIEFEFSLVY